MRIRLRTLVFVFAATALLSVLFATQVVFSRENELHIAASDGVYAVLATETAPVTVYPYTASDGDLYLFLPSCAAGKKMRITGASLPQGTPRTLESLSTDLTIALSDGNTLHVLTGSAIPSLFIELNRGIAYLKEDKSHTDSGKLTVLNADGDMLFRSRIKEIHGRGNTSWSLEQKPYHIELQDSYLLPGAEKASDRYSLISSYDRTFLNNRVSQELMRAMDGVYVPGQAVQVYIDGSFEGLYDLRPQVTPSFLSIRDLRGENITANDATRPVTQKETLQTVADWASSPAGRYWDYEKEPADISGGYVVEADSIAHYNEAESGFTTDSGGYFSMEFPARLTKGEYEYISTLFREIEEVLIEQVEEDDYGAITDCLDVESFMKKYIVEEVSKNFDNASSSQFLYKDAGDDLLCAGPPWDYDQAYGTDRTRAGDGLEYKTPYGTVVNYAPGNFKWWQLLYYNNAFRADMFAYYEETVFPYLETLVQEELPAWQAEIEDTAVMDYLRHGDTDVPDKAACRTLYEARCKRLSVFLAARREVLYYYWVMEP